MKTALKIFGIMLLLAIGLNGCASAPKSIDPNYEAYRQAVMSQKPLVLIEWTPDGKSMTKLEVNPAINIQQRQPDPPHPAWGTLNRVITVGGVISGIWAYGEAQEGIIGASQGATSISGSYNQPGGSMAGNDVSIPTTSTTETVSTVETSYPVETATETPSTWE